MIPLAVATQSPSQANPLLAFLPLVVMFGLFYVLLIRPQQKRQKETENMLKQLKKGDQVVTTGGMLGTIVGIHDEKIVLRVGEGDTKIEFLKSAVTQKKS